MSKQTTGTGVRIATVGVAFALAAAVLPAQAAKGLQFNPDPLSPTVSESGVKAYYSISLAEKPAGTVTVVLANADGQVTAARHGSSESWVRFTPDDYADPQTVVVSPVNDSAPEGTRKSPIRYQLLSEDSGYNNLAVEDTWVTVLDNDRGDIILKQTAQGTHVREGDPEGDSYSIVLGVQPTSDVRITISTDAARAQQPAQVRANPASVLFTPSNYDRPQTITVTAVDDARAERPDDPASTEHLHHQVSSADDMYNLYPPEGNGFAVVIDDDDLEHAVVRVRITDAYTRVIEGGAGDSYTLALGAQPTAPVTVLVNAGQDLAVSPASVVFNPDDFSKPQVITVTAMDDSNAEGWETVNITHTVSTADLAYQGSVAGPLPVDVRDNDVFAVLLTETGGSSRVAEGGAPDGYTLALSKRPTGDVTIKVNAGEQLRAEPAEVTFTAANYSTAQTVALTAFDDYVIEETAQHTVAHALVTGDLGYQGVPIDDVVVTVLDDDQPGILLHQAGGSIRVTEGSAEGHRYEMLLAAQPTADVVVSVIADDGLVATPSTLTFTPEDFRVAQAVLVTAADDEVAQWTRIAMIGHSVSSSDARYEGFSVAPISVTIDDDDVAALLLEETDGATGVREGDGNADRYSLRLASRPLSDVVVHVDAGNQLQAGPATLTFTADDYDVPQVVEVVALDDAVVEGDHLGTVTHRIESADGAYHTLATPDLAVSIADNDVEPPVDPEPPVVRRGGGGSLDLATLMVLVFSGLVGLCRVARRWNLG